MMKRVLFFVLLLAILLFTMSPSAANDGRAVVILSRDGSQFGNTDEITVTISLRGVLNDMRTLGFEVHYDTSVFEMVKDSAKILIMPQNDAITLADFGADGVFVFATTYYIYANQDILTFKLKVKEKCTLLGKTSVSVTNVVLLDQGQRLFLESGEAEFRISCNHTYNTYAMIDGGRHELSCSICGSAVYEMHTFDRSEIRVQPTHLAEGTKRIFCKCGAGWDETLPKLPEHHFNSIFQYRNEKLHVRFCACSEEELSPHRFEANLNREEGKNGEMLTKYTCIDCGYIVKSATPPEGVLETTTETTLPETTAETTTAETTAETIPAETTAETTTEQTTSDEMTTVETTTAEILETTTEIFPPEMTVETTSSTGADEGGSSLTVWLIVIEIVSVVALGVYLVFIIRKEKKGKKVNYAVLRKSLHDAQDEEKQ